MFIADVDEAWGVEYIFTADYTMRVSMRNQQYFFSFRWGQLLECEHIGWGCMETRLAR